MNLIDPSVKTGERTTLARYTCGKVNVICTKRVILSGLEKAPFQEPLTTFYPSEYTNGFNLFIYAYIPEGYTPGNPVFEPEFMCVNVPGGSGSNGTDVITRIINLDYEPASPEPVADGPFSLWEIRIIYSVGYENPDDRYRTQAVHVCTRYGDKKTGNRENSTRIGTIAQSLEEFILSGEEDIPCTPRKIHSGIIAPPLEPVVAFEPAAAGEAHMINLRIYAFIPEGFEPLAVKFSPPPSEDPLEIPMKGEDDPEQVNLLTRSISIWYDNSALSAEVAYGEYAIWEIAVSYIDPYAQMIRVCYCVGDPVTTRGTVTSVQRT